MQVTRYDDYDYDDDDGDVCDNGGTRHDDYDEYNYDGDVDIDDGGDGIISMLKIMTMMMMKSYAGRN